LFGFRFAHLAALLLCLLFPNSAAQSRTLHVSKAGDGSDGLSWTTAYNAISDALAVSASAEEIWVASGTYQETIRLGEGVALYGGFAGDEATGEFELRDWESHETIVDASGFNDTAVVMADLTHVDGFTIANADALQGGGVRIKDATASVANCRIVNNQVVNKREESCYFWFCFSCLFPPYGWWNCTELYNYGGDGGGVLVKRGTALIANCVIESNTAELGGGIHSGTNSIVQVISCQVSRNNALGSGAGIYSSGGRLDSIENTINENFGHGIRSVGSHLTIDSSTLTQNLDHGLDTYAGIVESNFSILLENQGSGFHSEYGRHSFRNCVFRENFASGLSVGNADVNLVGSLLLDNGEYALFVRPYRYMDSATPTSQVINCTIAGNRKGVRVYSTTIANSILWNQGKENYLAEPDALVHIFNSSIPNIAAEGGNQSAWPDFISTSGDWGLRDGSPCIDQGDTSFLPEDYHFDLAGHPRVQGTSVDIGAYETPGDFQPGSPDFVIPEIIFVREGADGSGDGESWESALLTVSEAIIRSGSGTEIWVANGTYPGGLVSRANVSIIGGFEGGELSISERKLVANRTVIDGSESGYPCLAIDHSPSTTLDGLTIQRGEHLAGGIEIKGSSVSIVNCVIRECISTSYYGGGGIFSDGSKVFLWNSIVTGNSAPRSDGGGIFARGSTITLASSDISANHAQVSGGGLYALDSHCQILNTRISENSCFDEGGSGLFVYSELYVGSTILEDCIIEKNRGPSAVHAEGPFLSRRSFFVDNPAIAIELTRISNGVTHNINSSVIRNNKGGITTRQNVDVSNCLFEGNQIFSIDLKGYRNSAYEDPTLNLVSSTIVGNGISGVRLDDAIVNCKNSILWNYGPEFDGSGIVKCEYSCIRNGFEGMGNIESWPEFQDLESRDWRLLDGSPCIDAGTDSEYLGQIPSDLDGNDRVTGAHVDMGVYETPERFDPQPAVQRDYSLIYVDRASTGERTGLNWDDAFVSLSSALLVSSSGSEVWVASGTYEEPTYVFRDTSLYGGFVGGEMGISERNPRVNRTVIDASKTQTRPLTIGGDASVEIDGFYLQRGYSLDWGGGIYIKDCTTSIRNCVIDQNSAVEGGGGVYIDSEWNRNEIIGSEITNNFVLDYDGIGGGVYNRHLYGQELSIENCLFAGNKAFHGSGVYIHGPVSLAACTFVDNPAEGYGDQVFTNFDQTIKKRMTNCIVWDSDPSASYGRNRVSVYGDAIVSYSNIIGGRNGQGNIAIDPQFEDSEAGDFRLYTGSPCIDSGTISGPLTDLLGINRPIDIPGVGRDGDGAFDMGAYEATIEETPRPTRTYTPTFTPTFTPTLTPTITPSPTRTPTLTLTPTMLFDEHTDGRIDARDLLELFDAGKVQGESAAAAPTLFHFSLYWRALDTR
jgi:hypothetical protein